ncbi:MFS transporter [Alkalihalobacillus sp. MEB130]|uniref:MFS transporter n=1 Tax=Alkalihalobacillus sp. MEB130 TaxID=2976704 RepID=UPI0028DFA32E|nr:MFS transporter [Alkalihalobacillus sp. MEB130]MDT8862389.1 MFS transporter [Alkalihalobacillus sp. MEB130]
MESKKALPVLFAVMFLVMVGFGIIIPVMPFYAEEIGATPTQLGLLMAVYSFMQLLLAPMWGRISDQIGRKPVIMIGIFGLALSFFLLAISSTLWMLFVARIVGGFFSAANMPTVMAYVADITSDEDRGKGMGIIGASIGLGFIFGPAIGGIFSQTNLSLPFYLAGSLSVLTFIFVTLVLKESLTAEQRNKQLQERTPIRKALQGPVSILFILQWFVSLSLAGLEATFAYFAYERANLGAVELGYIFMIMGLAGALVQGGLVGRLTKKYGEGTVIQLGIVISALGFFLILFVDSFVTAAIFLTVFGIGNGLIRPSVSSLLTKASPTGYGRTTGLLSSFDSLGRIIGPPLGGWLFTLAVGLPYMLGILLSVLAFILYRVYKAKTNSKTNKTGSDPSLA